MHRSVHYSSLDTAFFALSDPTRRGEPFRSPGPARRRLSEPEVLGAVGRDQYVGRELTDLLVNTIGSYTGRVPSNVLNSDAAQLSIETLGREMATWTRTTS